MAVPLNSTRVEARYPFVTKTRLEAFSDGVIAIAITLLVLDLAIGDSGTALHRVLDAWPFHLAYIVSFLTIGAAWLAHTTITNRLARVDSVLARLNLLLLFFISVLPFPTRLVAEGLNDSLNDEDGERIFVTMYGLVLLGIRALLVAIDEYARREHLYADAEADGDADDTEHSERKPFLPVFLAYVVAILIGLAFPTVAVALYCALAIYLVVPFRELRRLLFARD
jgi:uncharacterized membrane protein